MAGKWLLVALLAILTILVVNCSDSGTDPETLQYSGITANVGDGWFTSYDPDDWCFEGKVETDEIVMLTSAVAMYATDTGEVGATTVRLFNYSQKRIGIQLGTEDPLIGFSPRSIVVEPQSWGEFDMAYYPHEYDPYETVIPLEVTPNCETLNLPVKGYASDVVPIHCIPPVMFRPAFPNPFSDTVTFHFGLDDNMHVRLVVRGPNNPLGGTRVLIDEDYAMGWQFYRWVVDDDVEPGIYRAFIEIGDDFQCYGDVELLAD